MYFNLYDIDTTAFRYIWASINDIVEPSRTIIYRPSYGQLWPR